MSEIRTGIRLEGDASGYRAAVTEAEAATKRLTDAQQISSAGMRQATVSAGQFQQAVRQLPAQITDVVTSLSSGMPVWMVAIQQGGQIKDSFGGIVPALRGVLGLLNPVNVGFGALAVSAAAVAIGAFQGRREVRELERAIALLGPGAQTSAGAMFLLGDSVAGAAGQSVGDTRELIGELLNLGPAMASNIDVAARLGSSLQRLGGGGAADVAKSLAAASTNATDFAIKASKAYGALTAAQVEQIRQLQIAGQTTQATRLVMESLADTMQQRVVATLAEQDGWLDKLGRKWSSLWDSIKGVGRSEGAEERLALLTQELAAADGGRNTFGTNYAALSEARAEADQLRKQIARDAIRRADAGMARSGEDAAIGKLNPAYLAASAGLGASVSTRALEETRAALNRQEEATRLAFRQREVTAQEHQKRLLQIDIERVDAEIENNRRLQAIEQARQLSDDSPEQLQRQAALVGLQTQQVKLLDQRRQITADERLGKRNIDEPSDPLFDSIMRTFEADRLGGIRASQRAAEEDQRTRERALEGIRSLGEENQRVSAEQIRDAQLRGAALIAVDEEQIRRRVDLSKSSADEVRKFQEELAAWRVARERQLTEELKPEWQRMVEAWGDANKQMKDSYDRTVTAAIQAGENAWIQFAQTGKLSVKSLVDTVIAESARSAYRQFFTQIFGFSSGYIGGSAGAGASGIVDGFQMPATSSAGTVSRASALSAGGSSERFTIINQSGTPLQGTATRSSDGGIEVILRALKSEIAGDVASGQGEITQALQGRFGLKPTFSSM